jgi:hypothetical protein
MRIYLFVVRLMVFVVCLLFVCSAVRSTKREIRFRSLGPPRGQKSLGLDAPMGLRKSVSKFLEAFSLLNQSAQLWD